MHYAKAFASKFIFFCFFCMNVFADEPPKLGNFALPTSQQPGPLLSYGQTNIGKNQIQPFLLTSEYKGVNQSYFSASPAVLIGITDNLTALLGVPIAVNYAAYGAHSSGIQDSLAGVEYAFYNKNYTCFSDQATVFSYLSFPTGSAQKNPITGYGSPSIYLGGTISRTFVDWYLFQSDSVFLTSMKNGTKFGNQYFYQFGLSRVIASTKDWIFSCLLEINGNFLEKDRREGFINPDSGGNIVYVTPSLWFSNQKFIFQLGIGAPFIQKLNGDQSRTQYLVAGNVSYTIDGPAE